MIDGTQKQKHQRAVRMLFAKLKPSRKGDKRRQQFDISKVAIGWHENRTGHRKLPEP